MELLRFLFREALLSMDYPASADIFSRAKDAVGSPEVAAEELLLPVLEKFGEEWEAGQLSLAQVYVAGRICDDLTAPLAGPQEAAVDLPVAMAGLRDHHALGRRIVLAHLRIGGIAVRDYGSGVTPEEVVDRAARDQIQVLLLSALMLASALDVRRVRQLCQERNFSPALVVGGAPFRLDPGLGRAVGADAVGYTASDARKHVRHFLKERGIGSWGVS